MSRLDKPRAAQKIEASTFLRSLVEIRELSFNDNSSDHIQVLTQTNSLLFFDLSSPRLLTLSEDSAEQVVVSDISQEKIHSFGCSNNSRGL
jgi:hypothetical protein